MSRRRKLSAALGWVIVAQGALSFLVVLLTAASVLVNASAIGGAQPAADPLPSVLVIVGFLPIVVVAARRRGEIERGEATERLVALYFIASGLAIVAALVFCNGLAHDVALWLGHHGRFGCLTIDESGRDANLVDGESLPWLLFLPPPLIVAVLLRLRDRS
jgi:hypothetical protein